MLFGIGAGPRLRRDTRARTTPADRAAPRAHGRRRERAGDHARRRGARDVVPARPPLPRLRPAPAPRARPGAPASAPRSSCSRSVRRCSGARRVGPAAQGVFFFAFALLPSRSSLGLSRSRLLRGSTIAGLVDRLSRDPSAAGIDDALGGVLGDPLAVRRLPARRRRGATSTAPAGRCGSRRRTTATTTSRRRSRTTGGSRRRSSTTPSSPRSPSSSARPPAPPRSRSRTRASRRSCARASSRSARAAGAARRGRRRRAAPPRPRPPRRRPAAARVAHARAAARPRELGARSRRSPAASSTRPSTTRARRSTSCATSPPASIPAVLTQRGLDAGIESLATRSPVPGRARRPARRAPAAAGRDGGLLRGRRGADERREVRRRDARARRGAAATTASAVVEVRDDGAGGADPTGGSGLRGLADRVGALDGWLEVESAAGEGTLVRAVIPVAG